MGTRLQRREDDRRAAPSERRIGERLWAWIFITPNAALFTLFTVVPVIYGIAISFFRWDMLGPPKWVGWTNFVYLVHDPRATHALYVTLLVTLFGVAPTVMLGFFFAIALNTALPGSRIIRTFYFLPMIVSLVASAVLWRWIFDRQWGVLNWLLGQVGVNGPSWLYSTNWALPAVIVVIVWSSVPLSIILYLAALQEIPEELYRAARVDGAGTWARIRHITWPGTRPATVLITIVAVISVVFGSFDVVSTLTQGGPLDATNVIAYYGYELGIRDLNVGYASALATVMFACVFALSAVVLMLQRRWERAQ